ncbi:MAG: hypothetical protein IIZ51_05380 [Lachnospiraceae bacterium]|nr:hypothetical protein [Lachnospiraceae bacterium]MBQ1515262.1 hypothetical protein [Lachnospiraceae bacterium]
MEAQNRNGKSVIALILSIIAVVLAAAALLFAVRGAMAPSGEEEQDIQYVMYLGTNDKDTDEPVFTPEQAQERAEEILIDHFGGYTIQEAHGGWIDEDMVYQEYTLVIYLSDTGIEEVHAAAQDLIDVFHQSSVLIQANRTTTEFYAGE